MVMVAGEKLFPELLTVQVVLKTLRLSDQRNMRRIIFFTYLAFLQKIVCNLVISPSNL